jgi:MscS family membrane protein
MDESRLKHPDWKPAAASRQFMESSWPAFRRVFGAGAIWLLLLATCAVNSALAAEAATASPPADFDPYPLRPPDTSSPRNTLQSFLTSADYVIKAWRKAGGGRALNARGVRNVLNATELLDFSATPDSEAFGVQVDRMLLLKELLDRIALPPFSDVPGDREVAAAGITRWAIPQTRLAIVQIKEGPRAGEFLFSADTVGRLPEFYQLAKDLPYKPNATTRGIYEQYSASNEEANLDKLSSRLKMIDASSPRSTLVGFMDSINQAYTLLMDARAALKADPPRMTTEEALEVEATAENLLRRATDLLDLSAIPEATRAAGGRNAALQLKEVLDRTLLPFQDVVPDARMVEAARKRGGTASAPAGVGYRWRYPNTEIEIAEVTKGERGGRFLFSAESVRRAGEFYRKVRDLPYRSDLSQSDRSRFYWSGESKGFYDFYISSPGYLVSEARLLGRVVDRLPAALKTVYYEETLWQWIALLVCTLATIAAGAAVFRVTGRLAGSLGPLARSWTTVLPPIVVAFIVVKMLGFLQADVNITGNILRVVVAAGDLTVAALGVWAVLRLARAAADTLITMPSIRAGSHDASLIRIGMRILAFVAGCLIIMYSLRNLGADMVPLLAGLGVGGLAVALAAQRTFANFIGSLILFVNKPVRIGDFCRYGDQVGTIEHIGLLATRIRSLERTIVTVPNAELSETKIDNFEMRDQRLLKTVLNLRYETTAEQIRYILARLRQLLLGHPKVTATPARVRFIGYGNFSKDLEVFAYLDCADQDTFLAIQEDILLRMEDIVNEAGSGFAFPSQTAYLTRDKGVDTKRQDAAEARVAEWRRRGRLPFPEFEADERHRYEDVLDYPPRGSPGYVPRKMDSIVPAGPRVALSADDVVDLPALAIRLRGKQAVAVYVVGRLTDETRKLLSDYDGGRDERLKEALVRDLNEIIRGPAIYEEKRFDGVELAQETRDLLDRNPEGEDLAHLNRLLLDDAFLDELALRPESS